MIDGQLVVDAHMHVPKLSTVTPAWMQWAADFGQDAPWREVFGADGDPVPARLDALQQAGAGTSKPADASAGSRCGGVALDRTHPVADNVPAECDDNREDGEDGERVGVQPRCEERPAAGRELLEVGLGKKPERGRSE